MIEVELPDGTIAEFPDGTSQDVMRNALKKRFGGPAALPAPPAPAPETSAISDIAQAAGAGLRSGTESLAGMFGDANQMQGDIAGWAAEKLGASPETADTVRSYGRRLTAIPFAPSTSEIQSLTTPVVGESYQPQTIAGDYAKTIGQFAPAAIAGPGSFGRKVAMTVIPAVASETAGQLTEGSAIEPYARSIAALVGGVASAGRGATAAKEAAKGAPTQVQLKNQVDDLYGQMRNAGIRYDADEYGRTVTRMASDLRRSGFRPVGPAKEAFEWVDDLAKDIGKSPDFDDVNNLIQQVGARARDAGRSPDGKSLEAAMNVIKGHLDDFEESAVMVSDTPMPKEQFNELRKTARATALKNIKSRALQEVTDKADTYQAGAEAGIRNGISNLLRSKRGLQMFKGEERKALLDVAQGRKALRTLSRFGFDLTKLSGNATALPTAAALGAGFGINPLVGAGLAAAGTAAKAVSPVMTQRAFDQAQAAIRAGSLNSKQISDAARAKQLQALVRSILAAKSGENTAISNSPVR